MLFVSTSRYEKSSANYDGKSVPVAIRKPSRTTEYFTYTAREGDTFDRIATSALNDPERWWEVADINPHVPFPGIIPLGTKLRVPRA